MLGFVVLATLGAAPRWRVNLLISSARGQGKTTLVKFIAALMGPQAASINDFTEAGLRQLFRRKAIAFLLDEAEGEGELGNRLDKIIQFLRRFVQDGGAKSIRGSADGNAQQFELAGCALLSAIIPPKLRPQDASRIVQIFLTAPNASYRGAVQAAIDQAEVLSPAFRLRVITGFQRFRSNLSVYHAEILRRPGADARIADTLAGLLAAADMFLHNDAVDAEGAQGAVEEIADLLAMTITENREENDAAQCLNHLLSQLIEGWDGGVKLSLGRVLLELLEVMPPTVLDDRLHSSVDDETLADINAAINRHSEAKLLRQYGLRLEVEKLADNKLHVWLCVANKHAGLDRLFVQTPWFGAWSVALRRLEDAVPSAQPVRFDATTSRATMIPEKFLPMPPRPPKGEKSL